MNFASPGVPAPAPSPPGGGLCDLPGAGALCRGVSGAVQAAAGSVLDEIAAAFQQAQIRVLGMMATFWSTTPTPTLSGESGPVAWLQNHTQWYVALLAVVGLLIAAGRLALQRRAEPAQQALIGLLTLTVVTGCGAAVISLLVAGGDAYSAWIIDQALTDTTFSTAITGFAAFHKLTLVPALMIILALVSILSCIVQILLMLARIALLGLLVAALPLAASLSGTATGRAGLSRMLTWALSFALYKPVAATIYAFSFTSMDETNTPLEQMTGIIMIALAVVALPALMRFLTPVLSATTTAGGAGTGTALVAGGIATGARALPALGAGHRASPGLGGPPGGHGPQGARHPGAQPGQRGGGAPAAAPRTGGGAAPSAGNAGGQAAARAGGASTGTTAAAAAAGPVAGVAAAGATAVHIAGAARRSAADATQRPTGEGNGPDGARS